MFVNSWRSDFFYRECSKYSLSLCQMYGLDDHEDFTRYVVRLAAAVSHIFNTPYLSLTMGMRSMVNMTDYQSLHQAREHQGASIETKISAIFFVRLSTQVHSLWSPLTRVWL
jgi:hypothetical protein